MLANDFEVGKKFKNKEVGFILKVVEMEDGCKYFEEQEWGDIYDYVDEDLYKEIED